MIWSQHGGNTIKICFAFISCSYSTTNNNYFVWYALNLCKCHFSIMRLQWEMLICDIFQNRQKGSLTGWNTQRERKMKKEFGKTLWWSNFEMDFVIILFYDIESKFFRWSRLTRFLGFSAVRCNSTSLTLVSQITLHAGYWTTEIVYLLFSCIKLCYKHRHSFCLTLNSIQYTGWPLVVLTRRGKY